MNLLASLRYLISLDKHRHFARAAEACNVTQPALSNALRTLEREFGVVIVKRSRSSTIYRLRHHTYQWQRGCYFS